MNCGVLLDCSWCLSSESIRTQTYQKRSIIQRTHEWMKLVYSVCWSKHIFSLPNILLCRESINAVLPILISRTIWVKNSNALTLKHYPFAPNLHPVFCTSNAFLSSAKHSLYLEVVILLIVRIINHLTNLVSSQIAFRLRLCFKKCIKGGFECYWSSYKLVKMKCAFLELFGFGNDLFENHFSIRFY